MLVCVKQSSMAELDNGWQRIHDKGIKMVCQLLTSHEFGLGFETPLPSQHTLMAELDHNQGICLS